jgi:hypothetical protein
MPIAFSAEFRTWRGGWGLGLGGEIISGWERFMWAIHGLGAKIGGIKGDDGPQF